MGNLERTEILRPRSDGGRQHTDAKHANGREYAAVISRCHLSRVKVPEQDGSLLTVNTSPGDTWLVCESSMRIDKTSHVDRISLCSGRCRMSKSRKRYIYIYIYIYSYVTWIRSPSHNTAFLQWLLASVARFRCFTLIPPDTWLVFLLFPFFTCHGEFSRLFWEEEKFLF